VFQKIEFLEIIDFELELALEFELEFALALDF